MLLQLSTAGRAHESGPAYPTLQAPGSVLSTDKVLMRLTEEHQHSSTAHYDAQRSCILLRLALSALGFLGLLGIPLTRSGRLL